MLNRLLIAASALALCACATPSRAPSGFARSAESVGVLSIVGQEAWYYHHGFSLFNDVERNVPIADLGFDAQVEAQAIELLNKHGLPRAEALAVDRGALSSLYRNSKDWYYRASPFDHREFRDAVLQAARKQNLRHVLLLVPRYRTDVDTRWETTIGISVKTAAVTSGPPKEAQVEFGATWFLADASRGSAVAVGIVRTAPGKSWDDRPPAIALDKKTWQRGAEEPTPEKTASANKAILQFVPLSIANLDWMVAGR
jgi:hypothetical protein